MTDYGIELERKDRIGIITFNRPQRRNAFNAHMLAELERVTAELSVDLPRVVVVTGRGEAFSAGFDVNPDNPHVDHLVKAVETHDESHVVDFMRQLRKIVDDFIALPVPIIAAINGKAYGGGAELAVRCDMRVMDPDAVICFSEVRLGLMPDWGGGAALAHLIGPAKAADMILTARQVESREAKSLGLINRISSPGKAVEEAVSIGEIISKNGPLSVRSALEVIRQSSNKTLEESLALEFERAVSLIASGECIHGITAFLMKKEPEFPDSC